MAMRCWNGCSKPSCDTPRQLAAMREAIAGADAEALRKVAHSLKSGSANVGADGLAQLCKEWNNSAAPAAPKARPRCCSRCSRHSRPRESLSAILEKEH
jgi:HPt (histidine-containing phosphotransfer) domain-containing protein